MSLFPSHDRGVHTGMTKIESDIKSKRNEIKYQDVQENLQATA